jgi:hypothetical protein
VGALKWAGENAGQFDIKKTEAFLFTRRRNNKKPNVKAKIRVGNHEVRYYKEATRWLRVWLDDMLTLNDHTKNTLAKARRAQNRVRSLMNNKGLSPESGQRIQVAAVQAVALYGSELWWRGQMDGAQKVQKVWNEQGRRVTGCFRTTPQGALMNHAAFRPAEALLNNQLWGYKMREMMMPDAAGGGRMFGMEGNVVRRVVGIDELIPEDHPVEKRMYDGTTFPDIRKRLRGQVMIQEEDQALQEARKDMQGLVFWTDGLRKEDEWTGCAVVWTEEGRWNKRRVHKG